MSQTYPANGSIVSLVAYLRVQVSIKDGGKTFTGDLFGLSTPGGGALFGDVYTDDLDRLYSDTTRFLCETLPLYLSIQFFDKNGTLLGHFQSGAVSTVAGLSGGGSGNWS
jgi:hypothetical protein